MEDVKIVDLFWARDERAISETRDKYERYLMKIAWNILRDDGDSEESVNDTYLKAWNSMPENRPSVLSAYLGRIVRRTAIDLYRRYHSQKRSDSEYTLSLEEMRETLGMEIDAGNAVEEQMEEKQLSESIGAFLKSRPAEKRNLFLCRYYYMDSLQEIAAYSGMKEATLRSILFREREALKTYLREEGFVL